MTKISGAPLDRETLERIGQATFGDRWRAKMSVDGCGLIISKIMVGKRVVNPVLAASVEGMMLDKIEQITHLLASKPLPNSGVKSAGKARSEILKAIRTLRDSQEESEGGRSLSRASEMLRTVSFKSAS